MRFPAIALAALVLLASAAVALAVLHGLVLQLDLAAGGLEEGQGQALAVVAACASAAAGWLVVVALLSTLRARRR